MKVAIPSDDKIKISPSFKSCRGFLVYEIDDHSLVKFEYRINQTDENTSDYNENIANMLLDCNSVICNQIEKPIKESLKNNQKQILRTLETDAKKALMNLMCRI
ncbi:MAG: NifB/NifX family molybdenum-iron cluster-binding protein [Candidatus Kapaibacteriota bacterium]